MIPPGPMTGPAGPVGNLPRPGPIAAPEAATAASMPARPAGVSASGLPLQPGSLSPGALSLFASAAGGPIGSGGYVPWPSGGGSMSPQRRPPQARPAAPAARARPRTRASSSLTGPEHGPDRAAAASADDRAQPRRIVRRRPGAAASTPTSRRRTPSRRRRRAASRPLATAPGRADMTPPQSPARSPRPTGGGTSAAGDEPRSVSRAVRKRNCYQNL